MEVEHLFVPASGWLHLTIRLVTDTVVHIFEVRDWQNLVNNLGKVVSFVARQEGSLVVDALDESVNGITVSLDRGDLNFAVLIFDNFGLAHCGRTPFDSLIKDTLGVIDSESDILNTVTVLSDVIVNVLALVAQC